MAQSTHPKRNKSRLLLLGAFVLALATALVARSLLRPPPPVTIVKEVPVVQEEVKTYVLYATHTIQPGEFITTAAFEWREADAGQVSGLQFSAVDEQAKWAIERKLSGAAFRQATAEGAAIVRTALVYSGEPGFIAAVLTPGMRAVSIPTNAVASNAGLVSAGDWVDVILSLERDKQDASDTNPAASLAAQTILRKVRVLALNNNTASIVPVVAEPQADQPDNNAAASNRTNSRPFFESLTLEVSPADAERLAVAREIGALQVALRSVRDHDTATDSASHITRLGDTTGVIVSKSNRPPTTVKTYLGSQQTAQNF